MKLIIYLLFIYNSAIAGELNLFVFEDGLPKKDFQITIDGKHKVSSNSDGSVFRNLLEGRHFIEMKKGEEDESLSFYIGKNEVTQILLNLFSEKFKIHSELNEPDIPIKTKNRVVGKISGRLTNQDGKPIAGASIFIQGVKLKINSNNEGLYSAEVPEGRYIISFVHKEYSTESLRNITVLSKKRTVQNVKMSVTGLELEDFIVVAPHVKGSLSALIEVRRKSSSVAEVMGSEQISKSGDSDAASSLKRITGLTIVDGKYVYIRGLGERYSNVLLNGMALPSPDPTRRVVQLDLFPSGILQSLVVQKSYSPEYSGSFGGGTVILNTKDIPEKFQGKVSIGTNYSAGNARVNSYKGGSKDHLGIDDGTRKLPESIATATANGRRLFQSSGVNSGGYSQAEIRQFSKDMPRTYNTNEESAGLPPSLSVSLGDLYKYKGKKFGYLISGMYSNKWENEEKSKINYKSDGTEDNRKEIETSKQTVKLSGMLNLGADFGKHAKFSTNTLLLRKTTDKVTNDIKSSESDSDANYRDIGLEWQERQLFSQIFGGKHQVGSNNKRMLEWRAAYSLAKRYQPDSRNYQQDLKDGKYITSTAGKRNQKFYNELNDKSQDYSLKVALPLIKNSWFDVLAKVGGQHIRKNRQSETKRFKYGQIDATVAANTTGNTDILEESIQEICTDEVIEAGGCLLEDITEASDRYSATQTINAYFVDSEIKIKEFMRINIGARVEDSKQTIKTYEGVDRIEVESGLNMQDILPVLGTTFFLTDTLQLRSAYSETVSRPDFKDLNPGSYYDDEKGRSVNGNLDLKGTVIKNIDARLEWYFGKNESLSFGVFQKKFLNPIEEVAGTFDNNGDLVFAEAKYQLANVGNAKSSGFEIEARKNFGFISNALDYLSLGGNYSKIKSEMKIFENLSGQVTNQSRPLQGQSEYIVNLNLDYDNPNSGTTATLLFNVFGERIDSVGTKPFGDVYEQPFEQLDFVFSQKIGKSYKVKLKLQNLINPKVIKKEDDHIKELYRKGRVASVSYTGTF